MLKTSDKIEADIEKLMFLKFIKERIKKFREDRLEIKAYHESDDFYDSDYNVDTIIIILKRRAK